MYISGMIVAFILSLIILSLQSAKRRKNGEYGKYEAIGILISSAVYSILSWITVLLIILLLLSGKVAGITNDDL